MSSRKQIILVVLLILFMSGPLVVYYFNYWQQEPAAGESSAGLGTQKAAAEVDIDPGKNLYFFDHPYLSKADQLGDEKKYDSAIYHYQEASLKFEKEKNWEAYVWVNGYIGRIYLLSQGMNQQEALPFLMKALEKGEQTLETGHPYHAILRYYLGLYYYHSRNTDQSLEMYQASLTLMKQRPGEQSIYAANVYNALGDLYYYLLFNTAEAERHYLKAIEIKDALPGEKDPGIIYSYYNLISLNLLIGDYEKAQSFCYQAIGHTQYIKNHKSYWIELLEGLMANILIEQKKFPRAIHKLQEVIRINEESSGDKGYLAYYYSLLGDTYSRISEYDSAIIHYKHALALMQHPSLYSNQQNEIGNAYYGLGLTYLKLKKFEEALVYFNNCLRIRTAEYGKKHVQTALALQGIGSVYQEAGMPEKSLGYFQKGIMAYMNNQADTTLHSVPKLAQVNNSFNAYLLIKDKASALKQLYENGSADSLLLYTSLSYYTLADSLMNLFRQEYDRESARLLFAENNYAIYEEAIACAALLHQKTGNNKYLDLVFNFIDKRKSALLLEALNKEDIFKEAGIPPERQHQYKTLRQDLTFLQSHLEGENLEDEEIEAIHLKIHAKEKEYQAQQETLKQEYPYYAMAQRGEESVALGDVQLFSSHNNAIVLEYFWGEKAVYLLGICKEKSELLKINIDKDLQQQLENFQKSLKKGYTIDTKEEDFMLFQQSSRFLYQALVKPLLVRFKPQTDKNPHKPSIIIVPDGPLTHIPFEALITNAAAPKEIDYRKLNYLIKDFTINYNYSTGLMLKKYPQSAAGKRLKVLALSFTKDPNLTINSGNLQNLRNSLSEELPGAAKEIMAISTYMNGQFYMGEEATEQVFKQEAPQYDVLHLAVHGEGNSKSSYNSRLIFKKGADSINDGSLYSYELYSIPMKAKLAVLSACESGIGKLNPGEGMFSMGRGFVHAGCPAVVMSLWRVNDNATAALMTHFYQELSKGSRVDQSIRQAKLAYLATADKRSAHPANWAAFVAMGHMAPVFEEKNPDAKLIVLSIIVAFSVSALIFMLLIHKYRKAHQ